MQSVRKLAFLLIAALILALPAAVFAQTATPSPAAPVESGASIEVGDSVTDELTTEQITQRYTFEGESGQLVTITAISEDFDTYLTLEDEFGTSLDTDDDSAGNLDSRIGPFEIPSNGTYTAVVSSYSGNATGEYTISLSTVEMDLIEYTQVIDAELTTAQLTALYTFRATAGDVITVSMDSDAFDSYLELSDAADPSYSLISDDDGGGGLNSMIGPFTVPFTGSFLISASSLSNSDVGAFTLRLNRVELSEIAFGDTVETELSEDIPALYFGFDGSTGDVIDVDVESDGAVDTVVSIKGPDNYEIGYDDDSGDNFDPEIRSLVLNQTGRYTLVVQPYADGDFGAFSVTITQSELASLDDGPQTVRLNDKQYQGVLSFEGVAGETVRLSFDSSSDSTFSQPTITVTQGGTEIAYVSTTSVTDVAFSITIPSDGEVIVQIDDYSYTNVVLEVSMEAVEEE
ncbi:MAG: PPC domain-containing protein [Burkholderiales bacterium]|nr:PPC domain-containing protein [Anaerolineae bacterium]